MAFAGVKKPHEPTQAFIALRAAALGVDDLARQAVRLWFDKHSSPYTGDLEENVQSAGIAAFFCAGYNAMERPERILWRQWFMRWTDHTGRIITPGEREKRLQKLREEYEARNMQKTPPRPHG